jgi:TonB family protein
MLTTLLESGPHQTRTSHFMTASATVHAAIIFLAVYATAIGAAAGNRPDDPAVIHWVPMPESSPAAPRSIPHDAEHIVNLPGRQVLGSLRVDVPTALPAIDVQFTPVISEFARSTTGGPISPDRSSASGSGIDGTRAYDVSEVETPVIAIGGTVPEYPAVLRASGIEGTVAAEFVVTESGRADVHSLRIISATNETFVESLRRALPRMRFRPARIGGRAVAQLVQQQFVFRLDR